uniref:DUF4939 domain-containing protein n=1 Tax=Monopterus albus TaxID=43700 RepID=A0A3Q3JVM2_MONAL
MDPGPAKNYKMRKMQRMRLTFNPHSAPCAASPRRDPPYPEPDVFDGSVDKCQGFLLQCRRVFDQQPRTFRTDKEKISYVTNRLHGKALTWAEPPSLRSLVDLAIRIDKQLCSSHKERAGWPPGPTS